MGCVWIMLLLYLMDRWYSLKSGSWDHTEHWYLITDTGQVIWALVVTWGVSEGAMSAKRTNVDPGCGNSQERVCITSLPLASIQTHTNTHRIYVVWWFEGEKNSFYLQKILATSCSSCKKAKIPWFHTSLLLTCAALLPCLYLSHLKGIK